ncbi:hypothetical protein [Streptosporangium amethystogenes]|uniref:hypothetical protein n=1 Tax=Streptosporangium amethystogenes TaxID=2002 RepID=UPI0012FB4FC2|nr:hypothetical protein [Streptosporangium amethystogenes]
MDTDATRPSITGRDAVVSAPGPRARGETTVCVNEACSITTAMRAAGTRRLSASPGA